MQPHRLLPRIASLLIPGFPNEVKCELKREIPIGFIVRRHPWTVSILYWGSYFWLFPKKLPRFVKPSAQRPSLLYCGGDAALWPTLVRYAFSTKAPFVRADTSLFIQIGITCGRQYSWLKLWFIQPAAPCPWVMWVTRASPDHSLRSEKILVSIFSHPCWTTPRSDYPHKLHLTKMMIYHSICGRPNFNLKYSPLYLECL